MAAVPKKDAQSNRPSGLGGAIAQTGGRIIETISRFSPTVGGKIAKGVDVIGQKLGNPLPELRFTERAEAFGGASQFNEPTTTLEQKKQLEEKAKQRAGFSSAGAEVIKTQELPSQPSGDQGWARDVIDKMNKGQIVWDDNLRSKANSILGGGGSTPPPPVTAGDILSKISPEEREAVTDKDLSDILAKYSGTSKDNAQKLADELLGSAREVEERNYKDVLDALGVQKKEIGTVAGQQKKRVGEEKTLGLGELEAKEEKEKKEIEGEQTEFEEEVEDTREVLARNWRDMSMEVQRIMRARGVSDSAFAAGKETDVLLDFNQGLRMLAKKSTDAVANFAEATVETGKFYTREKNKLEVESRQRDEDIDTWVRQTVQSIQSQETKALSTKLNEIRKAVAQGNQLKIQTAQSVADKQFGLEAWLVQTRINYKNAVALAAKGQVGNAIKNIKDYRDLAKEAFDLVTKGGYEPMVVKDKDGKLQYTVHGKLPNGEDDYIFLTPGGFDTLTQNVYGSLTKSNDIYGQFGIGGQTNIDPTTLNTARTAAGLSPVGVPPVVQTEQNKGILGTIGSFINPFD